MNEREFEVMDELYFVISFVELMEKLDMNKSMLFDTLTSLIKEEFVRCYKNEEELDFPDIEFKIDKFEEYRFLASKKGLMEHNTI